MANNYTDEDKKAFRLKDLLNSKMSCLKAASIINEGNFNIPVEEVLKQANEYFTWLTEGQNFSDLTAPKVSSKKKEKSVLPAPTLEQNKILDLIADSLGVNNDDKLKQKVLNYIEKNYGKRIYPGKKETAEKFISERKTK